jgi:hypothetical protein
MSDAVVDYDKSSSLDKTPLRLAHGRIALFTVWRYSGIQVAHIIIIEIRLYLWLDWWIGKYHTSQSQTNRVIGGPKHLPPIRLLLY